VFAEAKHESSATDEDFLSVGRGPRRDNGRATGVGPRGVAVAFDARPRKNAVRAAPVSGSRGLREPSTRTHLHGADVRPVADVRLMAMTRHHSVRRRVFHSRDRPLTPTSGILRHAPSAGVARIALCRASGVVTPVPGPTVQESISQSRRPKTRQLLAGGNFVKRTILRRADIAFGRALPSAFRRGG
jgi:hypothetical protein